LWDVALFRNVHVPMVGPEQSHWPGERTRLARGFRRRAENLVTQTFWRRRGRSKMVRRSVWRAAKHRRLAACAPHFNCAPMFNGLGASTVQRLLTDDEVSRLV